MPFQPELAGLSDPTRREILNLLRVAPRTAGEIAARFPVSWPAISRHLKLLKTARLVEERRARRQRIYALRKDALRPVIAWLTELAGEVPVRPPTPEPQQAVFGRQDFS